jgi:hypothetical protein
VCESQRKKGHTEGFKRLSKQKQGAEIPPRLNTYMTQQKSDVQIAKTMLRVGM